MKKNAKSKRSITLIFILFLTSFFIIGLAIWSEQEVQLKPSDIKIISIDVKHNPSIEKVNKETNQIITLPEDVSYIIKYKIKRSFTEKKLGYYCGQDDNFLYVDMRGKNSFFPSQTEQTIKIRSDYELYSKKNSLNIDKNYYPSIMYNKDIKIVDISDFNGNISNAKGWILIDKDNLN